jgi:hypothetical protein
MMPYFYAVLNVLECHHPIANFLIRGCCFSRWEYVFQDLDHTLAEGAVKVFEEKVWVGFADSAFAGVGKIMA